MICLLTIKESLALHINTLSCLHLTMWQLQITASQHLFEWLPSGASHETSQFKSVWQTDLNILICCLYQRKMESLDCLYTHARSLFSLLKGCALINTRWKEALTLLLHIIQNSYSFYVYEDSVVMRMIYAVSNQKKNKVIARQIKNGYTFVLTSDTFTAETFICVQCCRKKVCVHSPPTSAWCPSSHPAHWEASSHQQRGQTFPP